MNIQLNHQMTFQKAWHTWTAPQKLDTQLSKVQFFMAKPKYSLETRLAVVSHYLSGNGGTQRTADGHRDVLVELLVQSADHIFIPVLFYPPITEDPSVLRRFFIL